MDEATLRLVIVEGDKGGGTSFPDPKPPKQDSVPDTSLVANRIATSVKGLQDVVMAFSQQVSQFSRVYQQATKPIQQAAPKAITYVPPVKASPYEQMQALRQRGGVQQHEISRIFEDAKLSQREIDVAQSVLYENMTQEQIAERLGISQTGVHQHAASASKKLGLPQSMSSQLKNLAAAHLEQERIRNMPDRRRGRRGTSMTRTGMTVPPPDEYDEENYQQRPLLERLSDEYMLAIEAQDTEKAASITAMMQAAERGEGAEGEAALKAAKLARREARERKAAAAAARKKKKHMATGGYMGGYVGEGDIYVPGSEMEESDFDIPLAQFVDDETTEIRDEPHYAKGGRIKWKPSEYYPEQSTHGMVGDSSGYDAVKTIGGKWTLWRIQNNEYSTYTHHKNLAATKRAARRDLNKRWDAAYGDMEVDWRPNEVIPEDHYAGGGPVNPSPWKAYQLRALEEERLATQLELNALRDHVFIRDKDTGKFDWDRMERLNTPEVEAKFAELHDRLASIQHEINIHDAEDDFFDGDGSILNPSGPSPVDSPTSHVMSMAHGGWMDMSRGGRIPSQDGVPRGQDWRQIYATNDEFMVNARSAQRNMHALTVANANPDVVLEPKHMAFGGGVNKWLTKNFPKLAPYMSGIDSGPLALVGIASQLVEGFQDTVSSVGGAPGRAAATLTGDTNPASFFRGVGDAAKFADDKLSSIGGAGMIVGAAFNVAGESAKAFGSVLDNINAAADRYGEYSPAIAQQQALVEIQATMGDLRRAQESGPELARYLKAQGDLQQRYEEIKVKVLMKLLPLVTTVVNIVEKVMPAGESIAGAVELLATPLKLLADLVGRAVNIQEANSVPEPVDPTSLILNENFIPTNPG